MKHLHVLLLVLVVLASGCIVGKNVEDYAQQNAQFCADSEQALNKANKSCSCDPSGALPSSLERYQGEVLPRCTCECNVNGTTVTFELTQSIQPGEAQVARNPDSS